MDLLYFEDFPVGEIVEYGATNVTAEAIMDFAGRFDPQVFHVDEVAARATITEGLIASGWHNAGMLMRMNCDYFLNRSASQGSPGTEEISWIKPVRPGDTLSVRRTTLSARPSKSRPELGLVEFIFDLVNQSGDVAMTQKGVILFKCRNASAEAAR
jgi:acyl dehydratase